MAKRKVDARTKLFMDFFHDQLGVDFVDGDTGEKIDEWETSEKFER